MLQRMIALRQHLPAAQFNSMDQQQRAELEALRLQKARLEKDVERLLTLDQLTGLYNRTAFINRVDTALKARGENAKQSAMIEFSVTSLPRISGVLGRHAADYLLSSLAARLNALATEGQFCCRLDYRSFALFMLEITEPLAALTFAKSTLMKLSEPVDWIDRKFKVEIGAGVALSTKTENDAETLLMNAGLACRSAGERGGPGYAFFNPALAEATRRKAEVVTAVQDAIDHHHLSLHYQPFFSCEGGELSGFEALMRLRHPRMGDISPAEFIPAAEQAGLVSQLGGWALAEACRTAAHWPQDIVVSVNVSPEQFMDGTLMTDVHNALELSTLPAYRLEIEVTESTMMGDIEVVQPQIDALRDMGCAIVLDDFGTGYSSLSYLWKFPFTKMKIDRSFVQAAEEQPKVRGMIGAIMDLSRNLGLKVTAEGVETPKQAAMMKAYHCNYLQGYLTGKPVPASDVAAIIMTRFAEKLKPQTTMTTPELPAQLRLAE
jgi:predicted signal transduction protein with EAL and GGDEF domain